jgi:hypothetical protein
MGRMCRKPKKLQNKKQNKQKSIIKNIFLKEIKIKI